MEPVNDQNLCTDIPANGVTRIMMCETKSELAKLCTSLVLPEEDIVSAILAADDPLVPYCYIQLGHDSTPEQAEIGNKLLDAVSSAIISDDDISKRQSIGCLSKRLDTHFSQRKRMTGHMFYACTSVWWFIYSDLNENILRGNHWTGGPHVHLISYLTHPRLDPNNILKDWNTSSPPRMSGSIHVSLKRRQYKSSKSVRRL